MVGGRESEDDVTEEEDQAELDRIMNMSEEELNAQLSQDQHAHVAFMTGLFAQKHLSNHQIAAILRADMDNRRALRRGTKPN